MPTSATFVQWQTLLTTHADTLGGRVPTIPRGEASGIVRGTLALRVARVTDQMTTALQTAGFVCRELADECAQRAQVCSLYRDSVAAAHAAYAAAFAQWSNDIAVAAANAALDPLAPVFTSAPPSLNLPGPPAPWAEPA